MRTPFILAACAVFAGGCTADARSAADDRPADGTAAAPASAAPSSAALVEVSATDGYAPERLVKVRGEGWRREVFLARSPVVVPALAAEDGECMPSGGEPGAIEYRLPAPAGGRRVVFLTARDGRAASFSEIRTLSNGDHTSIIIRERTATVMNATKAMRDTVIVGIGTAEEALGSAALGHPRQLIDRILARCGQAQT